MLLHKVISTEKVPFTYKIAGVGARSLAWLIDVLILLLLGFIGLMVASVIARSGYVGIAQGTFQLCIFLLTWGYFLVFEWCWGGQTPGKRLLGLRVIRWQGTGIGFMAAAVRNLVRIVDFLPGGYFVGFVVASCNRENRRLGDLAAGTLVVYVERQQALVRSLQEINSGAGSERGQVVQLRQRLNQLDREQKQTLLDLALRRNQLRLPERAQLFHEAAAYLEERLELPADQYESDEKFVLRLATLLGQQ
jgi:uncharacterized RDD family membrane protein YckC